MSNDNGWSEWKKYVLLKLEELSKQLEKHTDQDQESFGEIMNALQQIKIEINTIKVRSATWGAIGGSVVALLALIAEFLK